MENLVHRKVLEPNYWRWERIYEIRISYIGDRGQEIGKTQYLSSLGDFLSRNCFKFNLMLKKMRNLIHRTVLDPKYWRWDSNYKIRISDIGDMWLNKERLISKLPGGSLDTNMIKFIVNLIHKVRRVIDDGQSISNCSIK